MNLDWRGEQVSAILRNALEEDSATRDATTVACAAADQMAIARVLAKQDCVLAGLGAMARCLEIFAELEGKAAPVPDVIVSAETLDGVRLGEGQVVATVQHPARALLSCERVILNLLQRLSGIATATRRYVEAVAGTKARILDTRKTAPGLRVLDKYAVTCGGGHNHRLDLSDGMLIKNNHIYLAGGIEPALARARKGRMAKGNIEIEVRSLAELEEALQHGAEAVLLDNMSPEDCRRAVERVQRHSRPVPLEASGGITLQNVRAYADAGVDFISIGALTHSVQAVDLSMRLEAVEFRTARE
jgi:nicotinate-nucleotide pyrophosphorylase (carboxylating)